MLQRKERLRLMKPCTSVKVDAALSKACAAWSKADVAWSKAGGTWRRAVVHNTIAAYAAWREAYNAWSKTDAARSEAYAVWREKNHVKIMTAHAKECPNCKWDGNKLPQFD